MPALIIRSALFRGTLFWLGIRLAMLLVVAAARSATTGHIASASGGHPLVMGGIVAGLAWYDLWRRNEVIFLANLGIGIHRAIALYVAPGVLLELLPSLSA